MGAQTSNFEFCALYVKANLSFYTGLGEAQSM